MYVSQSLMDLGFLQNGILPIGAVKLNIPHGPLTALKDTGVFTAFSPCPRPEMLDDLIQIKRVVPSLVILQNRRVGKPSGHESIIFCAITHPADSDRIILTNNTSTHITPQDKFTGSILSSAPAESKPRSLRRASRAPCGEQVALPPCGLTVLSNMQAFSSRWQIFAFLQRYRFAFQHCKLSPRVKDS